MIATNTPTVTPFIYTESTVKTLGTLVEVFTSTGMAESTGLFIKSFDPCTIYTI
jgi:hypothetical protein